MKAYVLRKRERAKYIHTPKLGSRESPKREVLTVGYNWANQGL